MSDGLPVDAIALREEVKTKYRAVAVNPHGSFHFHTGRPLVHRLGYDDAVVARMPDSAIEAFAGVGNPFSLGALEPGERIVDLGSGGWFRLLHRRGTGRTRRPGCRRRYDRGNAQPIARGIGGDGPPLSSRKALQ